jgi:hypothetical protein
MIMVPDFAAEERFIRDKTYDDDLPERNAGKLER